MRPLRPRQSPLRKHGILIYCEGSKTEPRYLYDFSRDCGANHRFNVQVKPGKGMNALVTVQGAIREGKRTVLGLKVYDEVWRVPDVEHAGHADTLTEAVALAAKHKINLVLSNPSFEAWLLCHFGHVTKWLENGDAAGAYLSATCWKKHFDCLYDKADDRLYTRLAERLSAAVANARWLMQDRHAGRPCRDANPSTEVYKLIEHFLPRAPAAAL